MMIESLESRRLFAFDGWGDAERLIRLPDAIEAHSDLSGAGQTIAVIDSGINYNHPSLGGGFGSQYKVIGGYDFVDNDGDPFDTFGHGTEVAGILAASTYLADGLLHRGVAPGAKLIALRVDGDGNSTVPDSRIESALRWVLQRRVEYGITVVNISYGTGHFNEPTVSSIYGDEILALTDAGVSIVASSGNGGIGNGPGIDTPASDPNVISVGSVDGSDRISSFTERGQVLDLLAPGEFVYTTLLGGSHGVVDGTSFASPYVAGTIALMRTFDANLKPGDIQSILASSGVLNYDGDSEEAPFTQLTYPRLDVLSALELTRARVDAPPAEQALFGQYGNGNTMAIDRFGVTHFAYYDSLARTMRYSTRSVSGVWSKLQTIDNSLPFQGYYLSMSVDQWGRPGVAYFDGTHGDLKYAHFDGVRWEIESVDVKNSTGLYPSLVFDTNQQPVISYYRKTTGDLRVARRDAQQQWTITPIDTQGDVGRDTSIAVDTQGRIGIGYADSGTGHLKYAILGRGSNATWAHTTVDNALKGVSFISTRFDEDDNPLITYYDSNPADLKIARFSSRRWTTDVIASRGGTGLFSSVYIDSEQRVNVIYFDKRANSVMHAKGDIGAWELNLLRPNAGRFISCAKDEFAGLCRFSYYDNATGKLMIDSVAT